MAHDPRSTTKKTNPSARSATDASSSSLSSPSSARGAPRRVRPSKKKPDSLPLFIGDSPAGFKYWRIPMGDSSKEPLDIGKDDYFRAFDRLADSNELRNLTVRSPLGTGDTSASERDFIAWFQFPAIHGTTRLIQWVVPLRDMLERDLKSRSPEGVAPDSDSLIAQSLVDFEQNCWNLLTATLSISRGLSHAMALARDRTGEVAPTVQGDRGEARSKRATFAGQVPVLPPDVRKHFIDFMRSTFARVLQGSEAGRPIAAVNSDDAKTLLIFDSALDQNEKLSDREAATRVAEYAHASRDPDALVLRVKRLRERAESNGLSRSDLLKLAGMSEEEIRERANRRN